MYEQSQTSHILLFLLRLYAQEDEVHGEAPWPVPETVLWGHLAAEVIDRICVQDARASPRLREMGES
jgi:hypothetical protein